MKNLVAAIVLGLLFSLGAGAETINIEVVGNTLKAQVGKAGISYNAALALSLRNSSTLQAISNIAGVGDGKSVINLPEGLRLNTLMVAPGGCVLKPTSFVNLANGNYVILLVPQNSNGEFCAWTAGRYIMNLEANLAGKLGSALLSLDI